MPELPRNSEIADQIELLGDLIELEGKDTFRVVAYRRAAERVRETSGSVAQLALDGRAKELQGIGKTIEEKIVEIVEIGEIQALTKKKAGVPPEVVLFMKLPGLGPKTAARIWKELGVETLDELKAAAESERLRTLAGLGPKSEEKILAALAYQAESPETDRYLLGRGLPAVQAVVAALRELPDALAVSEAGSVRRRKETFRDLDIIASATNPADLTSHFAELSWVVDVAAQGDTKATVISRDGLRFDLRVVPPESFGNLLQHFTGSKDHDVAMREDAVRKGLSISEYGVANVETGDVFKSADEDAVYEFLGYQPIPPELRENSGELEAARRGELPAARRASRRPRRPAHAFPLVSRRQEHARRDARGRGRARLRVLRRHRPLALPPRGSDARAARGDRADAQALPEADDPRRCRGEHPLERRGRRGGRGSRAARLGRRVGARRAGLPSDGARARGDAEPVRRRDRPPHRPPDREAPAARRRRRARDRGRARDGNAPRDQRPAGPARPARRPRPRREGGRVELVVSSDGHEVRSQRLRRAGGGAGAAGWLDEGQHRRGSPRSWKQLDKLRKETA